MSKAEVRSLQKIKGGSYVITLPRWWIERSGVKKGQKLLMVSDPTGLRLIPQSLDSLPEIELAREDFAKIRHIKYVIFSYYMQGVWKVSVTSSKSFTPEERRELRRIRSELLNADIVEDEEDRMTFRFIADIPEENLYDRVSRMARFAVEVHRDTLKALKVRDPALAGEIVERIEEIMRQYRATYRYLTLTILRPQKTHAMLDVREIALYGILMRDLYMAVYYATQIAKAIVELSEDEVDAEVWASIQEMYGMVLEMYAKAVEHLLKEDVKLGEIFVNAELFQRIRRIESEINRRLLGGSKKVNTMLLLLSRGIRRAAGYAVALTDDAVNKHTIRLTAR